MKEMLLLVLLSFLGLFSRTQAQSGEFINWQGAIYGKNGQQYKGSVIINSTIVPAGDTSGVRYSQVDTLFIDETGIVSVKIGSQDPETFQNVDWSEALNLKVTAYIDGVGFFTLANTPIGGVPKSFYSFHSGSADQLNSLSLSFDKNTGKLDLFSEDPEITYSSILLKQLWKEVDLAGAGSPFDEIATSNPPVGIGFPKDNLYPGSLGSFTIFNSTSAMDAYNPNNQVYYRLGQLNNGIGSFNLYNTNTNLLAVTSTATSAGAPSFHVYGPNGQFNGFISNATGSANDGYIGVADSQGAVKAGIIARNNIGEVFGNLKSFREMYPNQPGKEIWYACVEGPEAAAYLRGTTQLQNGQVQVEFPEHFRLLINATTMTVILTPLSADSKGLAVVQKTETGFTVRELLSGKGNYAFDWEVKAVRKGYENFRVIRNASEITTPQVFGLEK